MSLPDRQNRILRDGSAQGFTTALLRGAKVGGQTVCPFHAGTQLKRAPHQRHAGRGEAPQEASIRALDREP